MTLNIETRDGVLRAWHERVLLPPAEEEDVFPRSVAKDFAWRKQDEELGMVFKNRRLVVNLLSRTAEWEMMP